MSKSSSENRSFDSARERLGAVYAKGLLNASENEGVTDRVLSELGSLVDDVLDTLPGLEALLESPRVGIKQKRAILDRAFADKMTRLLLNFLKVVTDHGRLDCLREIRREADRLQNEIRGHVEVTVHTAAPLTGPLLDQIQQQLTAALGQQVDLKSELDSELLGGLVVRVGDTVFDGSLSNRLERMRSDTLDRTQDLIRESLQRFLVNDQ